MTDHRESLGRRGFTMVRGVGSATVVDELAQAIDEELPAPEKASQRGVAGLRNLLRLDAVRRFATSDVVRDLIEPFLGPTSFAVRGIFFDKTAEANWRLRWHQDKAIPVQERHDVPGFSSWSVKAGVTHVYPPAGVLGRMLTIRLHLDACDATQGALQVLPGSHNAGLLDLTALTRWVDATEPVACDAEPGDVLLMRPLLAWHEQVGTPQLEDRP